MKHCSRLLLLFLFLLLPGCSSPAAPFSSSAAGHSLESATPAALPASPQPTRFSLASPIPTSPSLPPTQLPPPSLAPPPPPSPSPTAPPPATSLLFTGVIVPARCVQAAIDERGDHDYLYDEVREMITRADLAVGTFNATMSDVPPRTGCVYTYVLVGDPDNADAMARAGFDVMSVATNHIKNCGISSCGDQAFFDTLENLKRVGILPVGAGKNHTEAMLPVVVTLNGVRFGFVSLGQIEAMAFAGEDKPGIAVLNKENVAAAVAAARQEADVVIVMPHWGPEDTAVPNWIQRNLAADIVGAGADLVVGNHTHVVQAVQEIDGVPVFYGLGNFVFDQSLPDHKQGVMLLVNFEGTRYAGYEMVPTHVDGDGTVHIAGPEEAAEILERIDQASQAIR